MCFLYGIGGALIVWIVISLCKYLLARRAEREAEARIAALANKPDQ